MTLIVVQVNSIRNAFSRQWDNGNSCFGTFPPNSFDFPIAKKMLSKRKQDGAPFSAKVAVWLRSMNGSLKVAQFRRPNQLAPFSFCSSCYRVLLLCCCCC